MSVATLLLTWLVSCDFSKAAEPAASEDKSLFGQTTVWSIHLDMSAKEYEAMQPPQPGAFGAAPPPAAPAEGNRSSERNLFGTEFRWAEADFTAEGQTLKTIGIRYAGDITYLVSAGGPKRPMKLAFDKFEKQKFGGLSAVQLHAMAMDPSKAREALAYSVFRACSVPSPRTAFAEVTLSVPGRHDKEYLGLFTVVEDVDAKFLGEHFGAGDGLALKPFRVRGIDNLGENWNAYQEQYRPQREAAQDEQQRVIAFAKLVNSASDEEFRKQISSFIDVDEFLRFMAANALTTNLESFLALGHNYTLYLDPKSKKFHFIPGDLEFSFANLLLFGSPEQLMDLSVMKPYPGENKLPDRLLGIKEIAERYRKLLGELSTTVFTKDRLLGEADAIDIATRTIRDKEQQAVCCAPAGKLPTPFGPPADRCHSRPTSRPLPKSGPSQSRCNLPVTAGDSSHSH